MQFGWEILSPVVYITVDFKKVVSDLFQTGSTLVESECIKRKTTLSEWPRNVTIASKTFPNAIQSYLAMHQSDFTCKYPVKSLKDPCRLIYEEAKKDNWIYQTVKMKKKIRTEWPSTRIIRIATCQKSLLFFPFITFWLTKSLVRSACFGLLSTKFSWKHS